MKLLITGASGLLGSKLCALAVARGINVFAAYSQHTPPRGTPLKFSILDSKAMQLAIDRTKPDAVVHAAALTDVDKCEIEKELAWKTNVEATQKLVHICRESGIFLVYVSTDYVFDGEKGMYREADEPAPINYYGLTKVKGEEAVQILDSYAIVRASVIYGSTPATGKTNFALWLLDKLTKKEQVKILTDQWNSPTLNTNMADMILETIEKRISGTLHLAGATRLSRFDFAQALAETFRLDAKYVVPARTEEIKWAAKRPRDSSLAVMKAQSTFDNKPLEVHEALGKMKAEMA